MVNCKLCDVELHEGNGAKADKKMCKKCYGDTTKYRRIMQIDEKLWQPFQREFANRMDKIFAKSILENRYAPKCVKRTRHMVPCSMCGSEFGTVSNGSICSECVAKANAYRSLHFYNPASPALQDYDFYYRSMKKVGFKVPPLFLERERLIW